MARQFGFSFSWKRALGVSAAKGKLSKTIGVPLTKQGRQRKFGSIIGCSFILVVIPVTGFLIAKLHHFLH